MKTMTKAMVLENKEIVTGIYEMKLLSKELMETGFPGKFVNIYLEDGQHLLPRPISICEINEKQQSVRLIYGIVGKGTKKLSMVREGEKIQVLGPLGNGFSLKEGYGRNIIIGGGIGVPPLLELVKQLQGFTTVYLGFRSNPILVEDFRKYADVVHVATEDGSLGYKGRVLELLHQQKPKADMIYSCGPKPMLRAVAEWAKTNNISAELSLEERMACGIGACLVCSCKTKEDKGKDWQYKRVCKDGPVFKRDEVIWE